MFATVWSFNKHVIMFPSHSCFRSRLIYSFSLCLSFHFFYFSFFFSFLHFLFLYFFPHLFSLFSFLFPSIDLSLVLSLFRYSFHFRQSFIVLSVQFSLEFMVLSRFDSFIQTLLVLFCLLCFQTRSVALTTLVRLASNSFNNSFYDTDFVLNWRKLNFSH